MTVSALLSMVTVGVAAGVLLSMVPVGVAAGALNFAAAGGSLIPFLVLTAFGFPPLIANATVLAATPLSFVSAAWEIKNLPRVMLLPVLVAIGSTVGGVWFVRDVVTESIFRQFVPLLLILSAVVLLWFRRIRDHLDTDTPRKGMSGRAQLIALTVGCGLTSAYAGAFGGAVGVMILALLGGATRWPWPQLQMVKQVLCLFTSAVGMIAWAVSGLVLVPVCVALAVSMAAGGLIGDRVAKRIPDNVQRATVVIVTLMSACILWTTQ